MKCPECGSNNIITEITRHWVTYRTGDLLGITVRLPQHICQRCGNKWLDNRAENIINNTIARII